MSAPARLSCGCPAAWPDWRGDVDLGGMLVHEQPTAMLLHMPIGFEAYLERQRQDIERLELRERWPGFTLARSAMFRGALLAPLVETQTPARRVYRLPQPFHVRVALHEGDVGALKPTIASMQRALLDAGRMPRELYLAYLTCPRCEADRGGRKILVVRRWVDSPRLRRRLERRRR